MIPSAIFLLIILIISLSIAAYYMEEKSPQAKSSAKDVFSYLLVIAMLYAGVISFTAILWQYINVKFPDPIEFYYTGAVEIMRNAMAALVVVWPVYILMSWVIGRDIRREHTKRDVWIRKWLLYLTVFIAAITIIVDLVTLMNQFLGGELTTRVGLKVLATLIVAAAVLGYYFWELRRDPTKKTAVARSAAVISSVLIVGWIVAGFFIVGSPAEQRRIRMDEQRVNDLSSIQGMITNYWTQKGELPAALDDLQDPLYGYAAPLDPVTRQPYTYKLNGELSFSLCATFSEASRSTTATGYVEYAEPVMVEKMYYGPNAMYIWDHEAGEKCFDRTIDPELYKVEK